MSLTARQITQLRSLVSIAQKLLASADDTKTIASRPARPGKALGKIRTRRSGKELVAFRKLLKAERRRGVAVAEIAKNHGVSTAYIYQID